MTERQVWCERADVTHTIKTWIFSCFCNLYTNIYNLNWFRNKTSLRNTISFVYTVLNIYCVCIIHVGLSVCLSSFRDDFDPALLHPGFEPPHYELCTLRRAPSGDLTDAALAEDFEKFHKLRRSSSKCIRDHHCGSHHGSVHGSVHGSRSNLSMRDATIAADGGALVPPVPPVMVSQQSPRLSHHTTPAGRRSILVMKHSYSQDGAEGYRGEEEDDLMMEDGPTTSHHHMYHHQMHHGPSGLDHTVHRTLSNDF